MGRDSIPVAKDAYGYTLYYYGNGSAVTDYKPIGGNNPFSNTPPSVSNFYALYNGNIAAMSTNTPQLTDPWHFYTYRYDQLNRLKASHVYKVSSTATPVADYHENFTYDGNGNIKTVNRYGAAATIMDSLTYNYNTSSGKLTNNKLNYIADKVTTHNWPYGLDNQSANNYTYDAIGNMTADAVDTINNINWTVYNKIQSLTNSKGTITYTYNPAGQRASKTVGGVTTWYVRDAQGNQLALYTNAHSNTNWMEQDLYGSSRLGMWMSNARLGTDSVTFLRDTTGKIEYELGNHLDNILATITDKRLQTANGASIGAFSPDIATAQEYYAFGGLMPGRTFDQSAYYRFGFNGKENDNDVKGLGNQQDYGMRIYDPRLGRFLSVDPLENEYPDLTPFQFSSNGPIENVDVDGLESQKSSIAKAGVATGTVVFKKATEDATKELAKQAMERAAAREAVKDVTIDAVETGAKWGTRLSGAALFIQLMLTPTMLGNDEVHKPAPLQKFVTDPNKLTDHEIREIRNRLNTGQATPQDLLYQSYVSERFLFLTSAISEKREPKFNGRPLIVDENLSPSLATALADKGFNVIIIAKGTSDEIIKDYAKQNNAILLTNNEKDFLKYGITILKASENMKKTTEISNVVHYLEQVNKDAQTNPSKIDPGKKVNLSDYKN